MMRSPWRELKLRELSLDTSLFRKCYIFLITFEMLAFVDIISLILKSLVLIWGVFLIVHNFFIEGLAFKVRYKYILWSFLLLMIITSVVHMSIWFVPNLAITYYTAVCFFIFYGMYTEYSYEVLEKEMVFILKFFINFGLIFGTLSLLVLFCFQKTNFLGYNLGIFRNRLIGIYKNSNILAFSMIESIVACDILSDTYMVRKYKISNYKKWKVALCILINLICLFLSDSNASFVFLIIYATIRIFCNLFFKNYFQYPVRFLKSILITFGFCLVMMSVSFALRDSCQEYISILISDVHKYEDSLKQSQVYSEDLKINQESIPESKTEDSQINADSQDNYIADFQIGRQDYEVSSGRITLFKQGIEIFRHHPYIGIGRANLGIYARKYFSNGLIHPDLHNGYLTILVSCGLIGFVIFMVFSFLVALDVCKSLLIAVGRDSFGVFCKLFSTLVAYCGYCLFEKAILFDMTFMVGFFWVMLGYTLSYISNLESSGSI